jgi:CRP/FNR family nitrogen fixation transcriptional regulator
MATSATGSIFEWRASSNAGGPLGSLETMSTITRFSLGDVIYLSGDPADFQYRILSGACRRCAYRIGGGGQILDFLRPGYLFGYESQIVHSFSAEAIVSSSMVARHPRCDAERVDDSDPLLARRIGELAFGSVRRSQRRLLILGRATELEKVSSFLLEITDCFRARPIGTVTLPMSRYDIADYLALVRRSEIVANVHTPRVGSL